MRELLKYLLCILFGVAIGFLPYYIGTKEALNRPTVSNEFRKIKNKKGTTEVDVTTEVQEKERKIRKRDR
jgi:hypothetical protein